MTAIVVGETGVAAVCGAALGLVMAAGDAYAQRAGNMHGGVPPMSAAERAEVHAVGYWAAGVGFVVVLALELAFTAAIFGLIRRDRRRALTQQGNVV